MDVVEVSVQGQKGQAMPLVARVEQVLGGFLHLAGQELATALGNLHEMIGDGIVRPACFTSLHTALVLCYDCT